MVKKFLILMLISAVNVNTSYAATLLPLNTWAQSKQFNTLSIADTLFLTLRCSIAYNINKEIIEEYTDLKADGLRNKIIAYRSVYASSVAILMRGKNINEKNKYMDSQNVEVKFINDAYFDAMKKNMPIPHSLNNELLAGDVGFCNNMDEKIIQTYNLIEKNK
jgi:hypothetical protein